MNFQELNEKLFGGLVESEWHQHKNGGGWVQNTTTIDESVFIGELAVVYGTARVYGDAMVYGTARVYGDAMVYGDAWETSPLYIQGSRFSCTNAKLGHIQIGCELHTVEWWIEHGEELANRENFTPDQVKEYRAYVMLFKEVGR